MMKFLQFLLLENRIDYIKANTDMLDHSHDITYSALKKAAPELKDRDYTHTYGPLFSGDHEKISKHIHTAFEDPIYNRHEYRDIIINNEYDDHIEPEHFDTLLTPRHYDDESDQSLHSEEIGSWTDVDHPSFKRRHALAMLNHANDTVQNNALEAYTKRGTRMAKLLTRDDIVNMRDPGFHHTDALRQQILAKGKLSLR